LRVLLPGAGAETARSGSGPPPMPPEVGASRPSRSARNLPRSAAPCQGRGRVPCVGVATIAASRSTRPARRATRRSLRSSRDFPIGAGASFGSSRRRMLRRPVSEAGRFAGFRPRIAPSVDSPLLSVRRLPFVSRLPSPASVGSRWAVGSRALLHRRVRCVVPPLPAGATRSSFHGLLSPSRSSSTRCTRSGAWRGMKQRLVSSAGCRNPSPGSTSRPRVVSRLRGRVARKVCRVWSLRVSPWSVPVEAAEAAPGVVAAGLRATFMGFLTSKSAPRSVSSVGHRSRLFHPVSPTIFLSLGLS
jgi:hypothetical protein